MTLDADQTASAITQAFEPLLADIAREEGGFVGFGETGEKGEEAVGEKPPASQSAPPRADTDSKKTEHMMRDFSVMAVATAVAMAPTICQPIALAPISWAISWKPRERSPRAQQIPQSSARRLRFRFAPLHPKTRG